MKSIKSLPQTRAKLKVRRDGVKQKYWCGRKPLTLKRHPSWKGDGFKELKDKGWRGHRFTDSDGDGKVNTFDCTPLDATKQELKQVSLMESFNSLKKQETVNLEGFTKIEGMDLKREYAEGKARKYEKWGYLTRVVEQKLPSFIPGEKRENTWFIVYVKKSNKNTQNIYQSGDVVNNINGMKSTLKKEVYEHLKKDKFFEKVRIKFNTIMFNCKGNGFSVDFSTRQSHDGVTSVWQYTDYKKITRGTRTGYSYRKELLSDIIWDGDAFTVPYAISYLKDLITKYGLK